MAVGSASPSPHDPPGSPDRDNPVYDFATTEWHEVPQIKDTNDVGNDEIVSSPRPFFLKNFRSLATPEEWHRYIILGYFAYEDGLTFLRVWNHETTDWLQRHKIVWYNYKYYLDKSMHMPERLQVWATNLSHPYLKKHAPAFLNIDTRKLSWRDMQQAEIDEEAEGWIVEKSTKGIKKSTMSDKTEVVYFDVQKPSQEVMNRVKPPPPDKEEKKAAALTPLGKSKQPSSPPVTYPGKNPLALKSTMGILNKKGNTALNSMGKKTQQTIRAAWNKSNQSTTTPVNTTTAKAVEDDKAQQCSNTATATASKATEFPTPNVTQTQQYTPEESTTKEDVEMPQAIVRDNQSVMTDDSDAKQSAFQTRLNVPTNDGTMRITVRWTPADKELSHANQPGKWAIATLQMLKELLPDAAGSFYRWESKDLATWRTISQFQPDELRDYLSPSITYISSSGMYIFGVRFGFTTKNPVEWKRQHSTKEAMRKHQVWATESNSSCDGGDLCHAGYILMKAPHSTHQVRYLQSLRNRLPSNMPFFDIVLLKKTPLEQPIHHLAVQCGKNHVATLTKAISVLLTGTGGAIFVPRVVMCSLPKEQINKYFSAHDNYVKSLRTICLSPMVTNLDTIRDEQFEDGTVRQRTTREWATNIKLTDGNPARCDVGNGGLDKVANLLVPAHNYEVVLQEVSQYKLRLNPLERREARFRDNLPGLPEVIQIDISVQASLDCLEMFSSEDIWKRAPPEVRGNQPAAAARPVPRNGRRQESSQSSPTEAKLPTQDASVLTDQSEGETSSSDSNLSRNPQSGSKASMKKKKAKYKKQKATNVVTQPLMDTSTLTTSQELQELTQLIDKQQVQLDEGMADSRTRFGAMEVQLKELKRLDTMETSLKKSLISQIATNGTLQKLQEQQTEILDILGELARDAKNRKLLRQVKAAAAKTAASTPTTTSEEHTKSNSTEESNAIPTIASGISSLAMAARTRSQTNTEMQLMESTNETIESLTVYQQIVSEAATNLAVARARDNATHASQQPLPKKQKSVDAEMEKLTIDAESSPIDEEEEATQGDEDIYGPPSDNDSNNSNISMQFEDLEDASSMNSAPTDLDDQYTYSSDPDGGEPG